MRLVEDLLDSVAPLDCPVTRVCVGLHWVVVESRHTGLAHTYKTNRKVELTSSGDLVGRSALELARRLRSWEPLEASLGVAALNSLIDAAGKVVRTAGIKPEDIDLFVPHQANLRIIDAVGKRVGVPEDKVFINLDRYGNTSAASIPIALNEAFEAGRIKEGDLVLLDAFGAGATAAAVLLRW